MNRKLEVKTGDTYGSYTVIVDHGYRVKPGGGHPAHWVRCRCVCNVERDIPLGNLRNGNSKSCGCLKKKKGVGSPTHLTWRGMMARCLNPKATGYTRYGGAGVTVHKPWLKFENFLEDMGYRPEGLTLDRIDGTLGYSPSNCRWATRRQQGNNRKNNVRITWNDLTMTVAEWARHVGLKHVTLKNRLRLGWTVDAALSKNARDFKPRS